MSTQCPGQGLVGRKCSERVDGHMGTEVTTARNKHTTVLRARNRRGGQCEATSPKAWYMGVEGLS